MLVRCRFSATLVLSLLLLFASASEVVADDPVVFEPGVVLMDGAAVLDAGGYVSPALADWNEDGLIDLIVGARETVGPDSIATVRVYLNQGTASDPVFNGFTYAQSLGVDLELDPGSDLGLSPRILHWDDDGKKDMLIGKSDGTILVFRNVGTNDAPAFDGGTPVQADGSDIDVGLRAMPEVVDWDEDGDNDLIVGAYDGYVRYYQNNGSLYAPAYAAAQFIQDGGADLLETDNRSAVAVADLNRDGNKDLLVGTTYDPLHVYYNQGTNANPVFDGYSQVMADGEPIDPAASRIRPFIGDFNGDGVPDILLGDSTGQITVYYGVPEPCSLSVIALGGLAMLRRRRNR